MNTQPKAGIDLPRIDSPVLETPRLILRPWRASDVAPNTAMLSDPDTARYITADGKPVTDQLVGWRNAATIAGHWALHGFGMFVVEEKSTAAFVGRVGPWYPPTWPGLEVGWGIVQQARGKGYAVEAARAATLWTFEVFGLDEILHVINVENAASQKVATRLGATPRRRIELSGQVADLWVTRRADLLRATDAGSDSIADKAPHGCS